MLSPNSLIAVIAYVSSMGFLMLFSIKSRRIIRFFQTQLYEAISQWKCKVSSCEEFLPLLYFVWHINSVCIFASLSSEYHRRSKVAIYWSNEQYSYSIHCSFGTVVIMDYLRLVCRRIAVRPMMSAIGRRYTLYLGY